MVAWLDWLKKNKTVRTVLAAAALSGAGMPAVSVAAEKPIPKSVQSVTNGCSCLLEKYMGICPILEGDLPYCYNDKGVMAGGCGVRFKGFSALNELEAVKVTPKKGCLLPLDKCAKLTQIADANWDSPTTLLKFPEIESFQKIKLKDCSGDCPNPGDKTWDKGLILIPTNTKNEMNRCAADFFIKKAWKSHPNLFQLPLPTQIVIVDVIYNLGDVRYDRKGEYPKFKEAIIGRDLQKIKEQCGTGNARRDCARKGIASISVLAQKPNMTKDLLIKTIKDDTIKEKPSFVGEKEFWRQIGILSEDLFSKVKKTEEKGTNVQSIVQEKAVVLNQGRKQVRIRKAPTPKKKVKAPAPHKPPFRKGKKIIPPKIWNKRSR